MRSSDKFYIDLANKTHDLVNEWDPLGIALDGQTHEYDSIGKRILSGIINSEREEITINKVKNNLEFYGIDISSNEDQVEKEIKKNSSQTKKRFIIICKHQNNVYLQTF